jgi:hypothetical protein
MQGLWELPGRGLTTKWKEDDIVFLAIVPEKRATHLQQSPTRPQIRKRCLRQAAERQRQRKLSPDRLRRVLKKRG